MVASRRTFRLKFEFLNSSVSAVNESMQPQVIHASIQQRALVDNVQH